MRRIRIFTSKQQALEAIEEKKARRVKIGEIVLCMARYENHFFAIQDDCPHARASLAAGGINQHGQIVCPLHSYCYDLKTGREHNQLSEDARTYPIIESEDGIFVEL